MTPNLIIVRSFLRGIFTLNPLIWTPIKRICLNIVQMNNFSSLNLSVRKQYFLLLCSLSKLIFLDENLFTWLQYPKNKVWDLQRHSICKQTIQIRVQFTEARNMHQRYFSNFLAESSRLCCAISYAFGYTEEKYFSCCFYGIVITVCIFSQLRITSCIGIISRWICNYLLSNGFAAVEKAEVTDLHLQF